MVCGNGAVLITTLGAVLFSACIALPASALPEEDVNAESLEATLLDVSVLDAENECLANGKGDGDQNCALNALQLRMATVMTNVESTEEEAVGMVDSNITVLDGLSALGGEDRSDSSSCRNFKLTGKVQMVHYRNWVVGIAHKHNVHGWVANGGDKTYDGGHSPCSTCGCVLGHVEGSDNAVREFLAEVCRGGSANSWVKSCSTYGSSCYGCPSFYKEYKFCKTWDARQCKSRC